MKETNIEKYFTKKEKNVDINIRPLFINCIISIFSLCFLMDFYYFYHLLIGEKTLEKILFIIMLGVGCVFVIALRYSFYLFVGTLAPKYELLLILGIKTRDFWTLVTREYLLKVFLLGIREIIISNIMCIIASYIIFLHNISIVILLRQMVVAYGHFPRPSGPRSPARQGHIKRPVLRLAEPSFLRPANQCC